MPLLVLVVAALVLALPACGPQSAFEPVAANDPRIRYTGRFLAPSDELRAAGWPATQIEARFTGPWIAAVLTDTPVEDDVRDFDRISVAVDGGPAREFLLAEGRHVYTLARKLGSGVHHVRIFKKTEGMVGVIGFRGFLLARGHGLRAPSRRPKRRIELVGDSITAGYGNEGPDANCHWDAALEDSARTYGAYAARALGAEYSIVAWSGKGILHNFDPREPEPFPDLYDRVLPADPASPPVGAAGPTDAVVVNLGTNDMAVGVPDVAAFKAAYVELLQRLRKRHPHALIVLALGPMLADDVPQPQARTIMRGWLKSIEVGWRKDVDDRIAFIELWTDPKEGLGCDSHPNVRTHARLGAELAALLRAKLDW